MVSVWHQSTARAIRKHRIHLLSYHSCGTLMSYTDHSVQCSLKSNAPIVVKTWWRNHVCSETNAISQRSGDFLLINAIALSVCHKARIQKMPPAALRQPWLWNAIGSCVSWPIESCYRMGVCVGWDVSMLTEQDHFQWLKPYVLLSSSPKDTVWLKTLKVTQLVCKAFILLVNDNVLQ